MTGQPLIPPAWREGFRRHERAIAAGYLTLVVGFLVLLALPPTRVRLLGWVQQAVLRREAGWTTALVEGERLVAAGEFAAALPRLQRLDRDFPARDVRHGRDKERERLLLALGTSYLRLGKKGKALQTFQRLVAFDPLNYRNHFALALASDRLLSGWALAPEARDAFAAALMIHPSHLPSVRGLVAYHAARGDWADVRQAWQTYLDAYLQQPVTLRLGGATVSAPAIATGRAQVLELQLPAGNAGGDSLHLDAGGMAFALDRVALVQPLRAGTPGGRQERTLWNGPAARHDSAAALPAGEGAVERVRLSIRVFKPADRTLWNSVAAAYRNLLDWDGLAEAEARLDIVPAAGAADSVLARMEWSREGQSGRPDEQELLR